MSSARLLLLDKILAREGVDYDAIAAAGQRPRKRDYKL